MSAVALNAQLSANLPTSPAPGAAGGAAKAGEAFGSLLFGLAHGHGHQVVAPSGGSSATPDSRLSAKSSGKNPNGAAQTDTTEPTAKATGPTSHADAVLAALGLTESFSATAASAPPATTAPAAQAIPPGPSAMQLINPDALPRYANPDAPAAPSDASQWDLSGATPLKSLLASDPSLRLSGFQVRTHLAATGALAPSALADPGALASTAAEATPGFPGLKDLGAQAANFAALGLSGGARASQTPEAKAAVGAQPSLPIPGLATASLAPAAASPPPTPLSSSSRRAGVPAADGGDGGAAYRPAAFAASSAPGAGAAAPTGSGAAGSGGRDSGAGYGSAGKNAALAAAGPIADAAPTQAAASADAALASGPGAAAFGPATLDQAVGIIAEQAKGMSSPAASPAAPTAPQAVKELEISLNPQDLGSISVKLRLSNGKLSVVIGVSNAKTLSTLEGDRQEIVNRLTASAPSLQGLTLQAQGAGDSGGNANSSGGQQDAADLYSPGRGQGQSESAQGQGGGSGSAGAFGGEGGRAAAAVTPPSQPQDTGLGLAAGDLVV